MGADGGICWLTLKKSENYDRVMKLIAPFNLIVYNDKCHYEEHSDWRDRNPDIRGPDHIVSIYGSFVDDGLNYLADIISYDHENEQLDATFAEVLEDLETRPYWLHEDYAKTLIEKLIWKRVKSYSSYEEAISRLGIIKDMTIREWLRELRESLFDHYNSAETWT